LACFDFGPVIGLILNCGNVNGYMTTQAAIDIPDFNANGLVKIRAFDPACLQHGKNYKDRIEMRGRGIARVEKFGKSSALFSG
jgi:hypothetical protein